MPPVQFAKNDSVSKKLFRGLSRDCRVIRSARDSGTIRINFSSTGPVPSAPSERTLERSKLFATDEQETLRQLFSERPIWSTQGIMAKTGIKLQKLKTQLGMFSYIYTTGPWRNLWIRHGYDVRTTFEARYLQFLDFRLRQKLAANDIVPIKRAISAAPKSTKMPRPSDVSGLVIDEGPAKASSYSPSEDDDEFPSFEIGKLPSARCTFYQYCDVHVEKIQDMLKNLPGPENGAKISEKTGWLPPGFDDECRQILNDILHEHFQYEVLRRGDAATLEEVDDVEETGFEDQEDNMDID